MNKLIPASLLLVTLCCLAAATPNPHSRHPSHHGRRLPFHFRPGQPGHRFHHQRRLPGDRFNPLARLGGRPPVGRARLLQLLGRHRGKHLGGHIPGAPRIAPHHTPASHHVVDPRGADASPIGKIINPVVGALPVGVVDPVNRGPPGGVIIDPVGGAANLQGQNAAERLAVRDREQNNLAAANEFGQRNSLEAAKSKDVAAQTQLKAQEESFEETNFSQKKDFQVSVIDQSETAIHTKKGSQNSIDFGAASKSSNDEALRKVDEVGGRSQLQAGEASDRGLVSGPDGLAVRDQQRSNLKAADEFGQRNSLEAANSNSQAEAVKLKAQNQNFEEKKIHHKKNFQVHVKDQSETNFSTSKGNRNAVDFSTAFRGSTDEAVKKVDELGGKSQVNINQGSDRGLVHETGQQNVIANVVNNALG